MSTTLNALKIAAILGIKQPQYYRYESGVRDIPLDMLIALAKYYNTSTDYILELTDNPNAIK